jgi:hypothetical protein
MTETTEVVFGVFTGRRTTDQYWDVTHPNDSSVSYANGVLTLNVPYGPDDYRQSWWSRADQVQ